MVSIVVAIILSHTVISQPIHRPTIELVAETGSNLRLSPTSKYHIDQGQWVGPFSPSQVINNGYHLDISFITEQNTGKYTFNGVLLDGSSYWEEVTVYIGDRDYGRISGKGYGVEEGESVTLFCNSGGDTKWFFNGGLLPPNVDNTLERHISIRSFQIFNAGIFTCYGKQDHTTGSRHFVDHHSIHIFDQTKISQPSLNLYMGQNTTLTCLSEGLTLWTFNDGLLPDNVKVYYSGRELHLVNVRPEHNNGYYMCAGFSKRGSLKFVARAYVTVQDYVHSSIRTDGYDEYIARKRQKLDFKHRRFLNSMFDRSGSNRKYGDGSQIMATEKHKINI